MPLHHRQSYARCEHCKMSANHCSEEYLQTVNYVRSGTFPLSFLSFLAVMVFWICSACRNPDKARWRDYTSLFYTAERFPFYVLIIATANSLSSLPQLITLVHEKSDTFMNLCVSAAFFATLMDTGMLLISIIAPIHLFLMTWKKSSDWLQDEKKKRPPRLEGLYCAIVVFGSLVVAFIPLFCLLGGVQCYGYDPVGQWCWISGKDENCSRIAAGLALQIVLYYIPTISAVLLSVGTVVHIITLCCNKKQFCPRILALLPDQQDVGFTCPLIILTCYLICFSLINVISLGIRFHGLPNKADTIVLTTLYSLWGLIPAIFVFFLLVYELSKKQKNDECEGSGRVTPVET